MMLTGPCGPHECKVQWEEGLGGPGRLPFRRVSHRDVTVSGDEPRVYGVDIRLSVMGGSP